MPKKLAPSVFFPGFVVKSVLDCACVCVCACMREHMPSGSAMSDSLWPLLDCSLASFSIHGIFIQEYWDKLPFLTPGDLPEPGIEPVSPALAIRFFNY